MPPSKGHESSPKDKRSLSFHFTFPLLHDNHYKAASCSDNKPEPRGTRGCLDGSNSFPLVLSEGFDTQVRAYHPGFCLHSSVSSVSVLALSKATAVFWLDSSGLNESVSFKQPVILLPSSMPHFLPPGQKSRLQIGGVNPAMWVKLKATGFFFFFLLMGQSCLSV